MAGRIRSIKPEILEDEKTAGLTHLEWRMFVSLWLIADDYGNLRGDPTYILGQCLWASGESRETVAKALETLARLSLVTPYRVRGQSYIAISGWEKHQKIDHRGKPRMPLLSQADSDSRETFEKSSRGTREALAPDLRSAICDQRSGDGIAASPLQLQPPNPEPKKAPRATRKKASGPMPEGWQPRDHERNKAGEMGLSCDREAERFRDHHTARGSVFADWDAAFRTWLGNALRFQGSNAAGPRTQPAPVRVAARDDDDYSRIPGMEPT